MNDLSHDYAALARDIKAWGRELGFDAVGITDTELAEDEARLLDWIAKGRHGEMRFFERWGATRARPPELVAGTLRVISVRLNYLRGGRDPHAVLDDPNLAYIGRYALGRDYHKVLRNKLQTLADRIAQHIGAFGYRVFADSAPVMEVSLARKAGLGWRGKHTLLLTREAGSMFFLGEIYTDLALPVDGSVEDHCGTCTRCIEVCPTRAIVGPYELDARRCISYLTIENPGPIPVELRPLLGNRIYGCDDCQLFCPWNKWAQVSTQADFDPRNGLDAATLAELFAWSEHDFDTRLAGSAIRRIGHERWLRNIAVALGNAPPSVATMAALRTRAAHPSALVRDHVAWALQQQERSASPA